MAAFDDVAAAVKELKRKEKFSVAREMIDRAISGMAEDQTEEKNKFASLYDPKILKGDAVRKLTLDYDAFAEGLEPIYYWLLDALRDSNYSVKKAADYFAASEGSFWYGDLGMRRSNMEKRAMELIATINAVIKSVLNLLWDLKEFEQRLKWYEKFQSKNQKEKDEADLALKAIYLTEVDIKKGRAAINMLAQDLNFITIRDAFMAAKTPESVDGMDLNERVRRVLKPRVGDYLVWADLSSRELKERYNVEKAYLKSQINSMKLYTAWAKPYLVATNKLLPPEMEKVAEPEEMVTAFDIARIYIEVFGWKIAELAETKKPGAKKISLLEPEKWYSAVELIFVFRSIPGGVAERGHIIQRGRVKTYFKSYILQQKHLDLLDKKSDDELLKLVTGLTTETLDAMKSDIDKYVDGGEKKEEKPKAPLKIPIVETVRGAAKSFKQAAEGIRKIVPISKPKADTWALKRVEAVAKTSAKEDLFKLYEAYKKTHAMLTW